MDNIQGRTVNKVYFDGILVDFARYRPGGGCAMRSVTCCHHIIHTHTHTCMQKNNNNYLQTTINKYCLLLGDEYWVKIYGIV